MDELENIYGIGKVKAEEYAKFLDLNKPIRKQLLSPDIYSNLSKLTKADLKYKPVKKIPHSVIKNVEYEFAKYISAKHAIAGSYRRGKKYSRDIDLIMIHKKFTEQNVTKLCYQINKSKYLKIIHVFSQGPHKIGCIINIPTKKINVKLDIFAANTKNFMYQLLFTTGSAKFNILMRSIAKRRGYLLNQNGIFENDARINITSEKKLFKFLKMKYLQPHQR